MTPPPQGQLGFAAVTNTHHRNESPLTSLLSLSPLIDQPTPLYTQPPANAFIPKERITKDEERFPLEVNFCNDCAHLQLSHVINPEVRPCRGKETERSRPVFMHVVDIIFVFLCIW